MPELRHANGTGLTQAYEASVPARLEGPIRLRLWTPKWHRISIAFAVLVLVVEALLGVQLVREGFTPLAWVWFLGPNVLLLPPAIAWVVRMLGPHLHTLVLRDRALEYHRPGVPTVEIAYDQVAGYWLRDDGEAWLRIETRDGRDLYVSGTGFGADPPKQDVVRVLGPRVPLWTIQGRGERPEDPAEARVWDFYGDPPLVPMTPGRRYRYLSPSVAPPTIVLGFALLFQTMMAIQFATKFLTSSSIADRLFYLPGLLLVLCLIAWLVYYPARLRSSKEDRFEIVPEGLRIVRGKRSWVVTNPRPVSFSLFLKRLHCQPILKYGRGLRSYYFDPRLIVEDD